MSGNKFFAFVRLELCLIYWICLLGRGGRLVIWVIRENPNPIFRVPGNSGNLFYGRSSGSSFENPNYEIPEFPEIPEHPPLASALHYLVPSFSIVTTN